MSRTFSLVGVTSSGKSTISNLVTGRYLLPNEEVESPRVIVEIAHHDRPVILVRSPLGSQGFEATTDQAAREHVTALRDEILRSALPSGRIEVFAPWNCVTRPRKWWHFQPEPKRPMLPQGDWRIRDLPGFLHQRDQAAEAVILRELKESRILFVFKAHDTDPFNEVELLSAVLKAVQGFGKPLDRLCFILNRIDEMTRNRDRRDELTPRLSQIRRLIREQIDRVFGKDMPTPPLFPLAALPMLLGEVLVGDQQFCSSEDHDFSQRTASAMAPALLKDRLEDLPRSDWQRRHRRRYLEAMEVASGWLELRRHLCEWGNLDDPS